MSKEDLQRRSNDELLELWKRMTSMFHTPVAGGDKHSNGEANLKRTEHCVAGLLKLSQETESRGLQLVETKFGKIMFETKPTRCSKCGDEGWIYQGNGRVRQCNCKPIKQKNENLG